MDSRGWRRAEDGRGGRGGTGPDQGRRRRGEPERLPLGRAGSRRAGLGSRRAGGDVSRYQSVRLFCLPYAGGTARIFAGWAADLPSWIDVVPLELPGHGFRFDEPVCDDLTQLVADLRDQVLARLDRRYAVFGHSLGALLGYELIQVLQGKDEPAVHFFPSGAGAPHIPTRNPAAGYSAEELRAHIAELGGTPRELVENDELMELMYPVL